MGAGSWGTTFAKVLADAGNDIWLWARRDETAEEINDTRRNGDYVPGVVLPTNLRATSDVAAVLDGATQVYIAVPAQSLRANLTAWGHLIPADAILVSLMKGVERDTGLRMSEVIAEATGFAADQIAVVSGPNLSQEIAAEQPAASVASSTSRDTTIAVAEACTNSYFTCFRNNDVIGTEFGRTPGADFNEGAMGTGRDHHPHGFTCVLAGGGTKGGYVHGATDEFGFKAVQDRVHVHDLQATVLHLLGLDHERLTYRHSGRDFRLTDVHGHVVHRLIA